MPSLQTGDVTARIPFTAANILTDTYRRLALPILHLLYTGRISSLQRQLEQELIFWSVCDRVAHSVSQYIYVTMECPVATL